LHIGVEKMEAAERNVVIVMEAIDSLPEDAEPLPPPDLLRKNVISNHENKNERLPDKYRFSVRFCP
jgi:hypothetical protein